MAMFEGVRAAPTAWDRRRAAVCASWRSGTVRLRGGAGGHHDLVQGCQGCTDCVGWGEGGRTGVRLRGRVGVKDDKEDVEDVEDIEDAEDMEDTMEGMEDMEYTEDMEDTEDMEYTEGMEDRRTWRLQRTKKK